MVLIHEPQLLRVKGSLSRRLVGDFVVSDRSCRNPSAVPQVPPAFPSAVVRGPIWSISNCKFDDKFCCLNTLVAQSRR